MTIDEAIRLLKTASQGWPLPPNEDYYKALDLGIEALRAVKDSRFDPSTYTSHLLPGETKKKVKRR